MKRPFDFFSYGGANILAHRIRKYWRARGHEVEIVIEPIAASTLPAVVRENASVLWAVRSNLLNGWPRPRGA